jgi:hypothetical protein
VRLRNHCCRGKIISISFWSMRVCVSAIKRGWVRACAWVREGVVMCAWDRAYTCAFSLIYPACKSHASYCLRPLWFYHVLRLYLKWHGFRRKSCWTWSMFWFYLQTLYKIFPIIRRIQRNIVINVKTSLCKVPVILAGLEWNLKLLERFPKKLKY